MKFTNWQPMKESTEPSTRRGGWRWGTTVAATTIALTAGLGTTWVPTAHAFFYPFDLEPDAGDFEACAANLTAEGVDEALAAAVCGRALHPEDLGACVVEMDYEALSVDAVLSACTQVRRPDELAGCFNDIRGQDTAVAEANVLDNCRRSLLPERFANCVVGLRQEVMLSTDEVMASCIAAGDRPRNVLPSFERF